jgi:hypothetical protein
MSSLSDEQLLKRARHASTNLWALGVLAALPGIGLIALAAFDSSMSRDAWVFGVAFWLVAGGYWVLGTAARRGDQRSVAIVVAVLVVHLCIFFISQGVIAMRRGDAAFSDGGGIVGAAIGFVVMLILARNYQELVELRKRGLWDQVFGACKPGGHLCIAGGVLFVLGFLCMYGEVVHQASRLKAAQTRMTHAQSFMNMIRTEEQELAAAMKDFGGVLDPAKVQTALDAVARLEQRALHLQKECSDDQIFAGILTTYISGTREYKDALTILQQASPDVQEFQRKLKAGDDLRNDACVRFDQRYSLPKVQ